MLRALRNKSQSFLFKIFLVLIVIGFAAWGVGDLTGNKIPPIFKSNDFEISYEQVINDFNKSRATNTGMIDTQIAIQNGILNNVLIQNKSKLILNQESKYLDLTVPRSIIKKQISNNDLFKDKSNNKEVFSEEKFNILLKNNNLTESEYIENLQLEILNNKIFDHVNSINVYNKSFSKDFYKWQSRQLDLDYIFTPYIETSNKILDDNDKKTYFNKKKDEFNVPKLRNLSYILFKPDLFYEDVNVTEEEIKNAYDERIDEFTIPERRNYFQIIFKTKKEADNFYKKILNNDDFLGQAKLINLKENDIKFNDISKDDLTNNMKDLIFKTSKIGLIEPFKTSFGFHVVQINKIKKEKVKLINDVRNILKKDLIHNLATEKLYEKIEFINDLAFSGNNLNEIIKLSEIKNLKINKKLNLGKDGSIYINFKPTKSNFNKNLLNEIWKLDVNEVSELIEINENEFFLLNIDSEINKKQLTYKEAENLVSEKLYIEKRIRDTKLQSEKNFKIKGNNSLKKISGLKRIDNESLDKLFNSFIINIIFKSSIGEIKSIETTSGILTFKVIKENFKSKFDTKIVEQIDSNFKENLLSDVQSNYYKNFEIFHKITSNLQPLESLVKLNQ